MARKIWFGLLVYTGVSFITIGILHFVFYDNFMGIMPPYIPFHSFCVIASGIAEILLGIMVFIPRTRRLAGFGIWALLVVVFPANIYMAMNGVHFPGLEGPEWALWARLPMQFVMAFQVWWVCIRPEPAAS